ncbi:hypothetical protein FRC20_002656 [Serendipita sp. 405]|nr:hypothetical protein FRC20_002656 [Serendipita sp. 405]
MRQSNVCSPAQNQACLLITSRLYDRRGLDCTAPLPLFNSLAHLVHLTATSPKIREILTKDGGLERLVRILRDFVACPPPVQDAGGFYGLLPPVPRGNSSAATALASLSPSMTPSNPHSAVLMAQAPPLHTNLLPMPIPTNPTVFPDVALDPMDPSQSVRYYPDSRPFDRDAAQRFSLAFQCIVNVGVRGSEAIRSRVVQAGTLEVVASILEAWLVSKGFPLVMPRRGKKKESVSAVGIVDQTDSHPISSNGDADGDERMEDDVSVNAGSSQRSATSQRARTVTITPHTAGRQRVDARSSRTNAAAASSIARPSAPRPGSGPSVNSATQTTPRHSLVSLGSGQMTDSSSSTTPEPISYLPNDSTTSLLPTPSDTSPTAMSGQQQQPANPITRGRSGTLVVQRSRQDTPTSRSRQNSIDTDGDADTEQMGNRSGTNTEDEDMEAESSNNEIEMDGASTRRGEGSNTVTRVIHHPVAVADSHGLAPHGHSDSLSLPGGGPGMGMGMEVDVLAAVNMVMNQDGVAAFEGTQFGGDAANAAAAEALARAGREGMMNEETPRAVLRNMSERMGPLDGGELGRVDEEMMDGQQPQASNPRSPTRPAHTTSVDVSNTPIAVPRSLGFDNTENAPTPNDFPPNPQGGGGHANVQGGAAAGNPAPNAGTAPSIDRSRFKVMTGDAGPFRQEDVLRALQLLAYLTKYPHVRQEFYKKRIHLPAGMTGTAPGATVSTGSGVGTSYNGRTYSTDIKQFSSVAPVSAALAAGHTPQITTLFSLVERFTFRPSMSHLSLHPSLMIPTIPPEIQSWAAVIMRNACRKDDSQGGIRQCANMTCGKWERSPREFAKCRRCRKAKYCGKECQSKAWSMGHRYWCSAREGGEAGQVPMENLDQDNEEPPSTGPNGAVVGQTNTGGPIPGMGIGIAPGGGVGLVPLNPRTVHTDARVRNASPGGPMSTSVQITPGTNGGFTWDSPAPPNAAATPNTIPPNQSSTSLAGSSGPRRRDHTPTQPATTNRFTRGITDRLRALGGNPAAEGNASPLVPPQQPDSSSSRARAWERIFGRDNHSTTAVAGPSSLGSERAIPQGADTPPVPLNEASRSQPQIQTRSSSSGPGMDFPSRSTVESEQWSRLVNSRSRVDENVYNPGSAASQVGNVSTQADLSGMVRNNLVLANHRPSLDSAASASTTASTSTGLRTFLMPETSHTVGSAPTLNSTSNGPDYAFVNLPADAEVGMNRWQ